MVMVVALLGSLVSFSSKMWKHPTENAGRIHARAGMGGKCHGGVPVAGQMNGISIHFHFGIHTIRSESLQ